MKNKIVVFALIAMVGMFAAGCGDTSSSQAGSASTESAGVSAASKEDYYYGKQLQRAPDWCNYGHDG